MPVGSGRGGTEARLGGRGVALKISSNAASSSIPGITIAAQLIGTDPVQMMAA